MSFAEDGAHTTLNYYKI